MERGGSFFKLLLILSAFFVLSGCAAQDAGRGTGAADDLGEEIAHKDDVQKVEPDVVTEEEERPPGIYDIEEEMPETRKLDEKEAVEEELRITKRDSFQVEDLTKETRDVASHSIGYRIQVFASSSLEKAKEMKEMTAEQTSMRVYIEYEKDMYKVRVGDFKTRSDAAEARKKLTVLYPDCWIAETTIKR